MAPQLSEYPEPIGSAGRWIIHPAKYDPSRINAEDVEHDSALRGLRPEEVEAVPPAWLREGARVVAGLGADREHGKIIKIDWEAGEAQVLDLEEA